MTEINNAPTAGGGISRSSSLASLKSFADLEKFERTSPEVAPPPRSEDTGQTEITKQAKRVQTLKRPI